MGWFADRLRTAFPAWGFGPDEAAGDDGRAMATRSSRFTHAIGGALDDAPGWVRAALAAVEGGFVSLVLLVLPVFLVWLASPSVSVGGWRAVQLGLAGWCLAHGGAVAVKIGTISLVPLLYTAVTVLTASWSAGRLAAGLARKVPGRLAWLGGLRSDVAREGAVFVGAYTVLGLLAALLARSADFTPSIWRSLLGFLAVGFTAYVVGLRSEFRADLPDVAPGLDPGQRVAGWVRSGARGGLQALAVLWVIGLLVVFLVLVARFDRVAGLYDALSPGVLGGVVLTGVQALYLPDLAVWAMSWLAGPGFGIGVDSSVTLTSAQPGLMPLVPLFGALPEPGPLPLLARLGLAVPVVVGVLMERTTGRGVGGDPLDRALAAAAGCLTAAAGAVVLGLLAGGSLGSARLASIGAPPLLLGALLGGELALGAAIALGVRYGRTSLRGRPQGDPAEPTEPIGPIRPVGADSGRPQWPSRRG